MNEALAIAAEVRAALEDGGRVVALETTLVAHGFPAPEGVEVALASETAVRDAGAVPATIGVLDGEIRVGLSADELERFTREAHKLGSRDIAPCLVAGDVGATTVGGTLAVARLAGIRFMGTGGIGGVHRGFAARPDISADLVALGRTPALVVASGVKSLLDVPATIELLETLGVPVLGYRTDTLPLFYEADGGPKVQRRVDDAVSAARIAAAHWELLGAGLLLGNPPPRSLSVEPLIAEALARAEDEDVTGQDVTPFVLSFLHEASGGDTLRVNRDLIVANARLAAEVSVAFAAL